MRNYSKQCWLSALYVAFYLRPQTYSPLEVTFENIADSGMRWKCNLIVGKTNWEGIGVSKRKAKQDAAQKACEHFGFGPVEHAKSYKLPDPSGGANLLHLGNRQTVFTGRLFFIV